MAMQLLAYANVYSPKYEEDDLNLNLLGLDHQSNTIHQLEEEKQQELAKFEAEVQRIRTLIENKHKLRIARINLIYENAIFIENDSHQNVYPSPKDFIALIEKQVGVINFVKDLEILGPAVKTAFTGSSPFFKKGSGYLTI